MTPATKQPEIGKAIRKYRRFHLLTQTELAKELGVSFATVNRWENGHTMPSNLAILALKYLFSKYGGFY